MELGESFQRGRWIFPVRRVDLSGKEGDLSSVEGKSFWQKADDTLVARLFEDKLVFGVAANVLVARVLML